MMNSKQTMIWTALRICLGWIFLWSFLDSTFGLGFPTQSGQAWINDHSPTYGYLAFATRGPLAPFFQSLAPNPVIHWLHMFGMLGVGLALMLGIGIRFASLMGILQMALIYLAQLSPIYNPVVDEHIIYSLVLLSFVFVELPVSLSVRKWWLAKRFVQQFAIFQ
jgi:thiosulfate dehydrogenase [quinone] large subunit